jgi:beta-lactamase class A
VPSDAVAVPNTARLSGSDRFTTSVAASVNAFPNGARTVLIASGFAPADGVVAAGLSAGLSAPLLYVQPGGVPSPVRSEVARLAPERIVVVGGPASVSDSVIAELSALAPVERYGGADRYENSRIALSSVGQAAKVYISGGAVFVDNALSSVAAASSDGGALLVNGALPTADQASIDTLRAVGATTVILVGGLATVGGGYEQGLRNAGFSVERRVAADRYGVTVLMADERASAPARAIVANSFAVSDLAVATALAAATRQPLFYAIEPCVPDGVSAKIASFGVGVTAVGGAAWIGASVLVNRSCTQETNDRGARLNQAIRATAAMYQGSFSVSVHQLDGLGVMTDVNGGVSREPASMMKIYAAWAALQKIERGEAGWGTVLPSGIELSTCLYVMIHASDNGCHSDIVHWLGIGHLNWMIQSSGWGQTAYGSVPPGTSVLYAGNRTTTNNLANIVERLYYGNALSRPFADHELNLMSSQIWRSRIASGIPPGIRQATKPGALWIDSGLLQGDTGVVWGAQSTYVLSIVGDDAAPQAALRAISRTVYEFFNGGFGDAAWYPAEQMTTVRATALRTSPGGPMTVVLPAGTPVEVLDADRIWYKIRYGNRQLWTVFSDLQNR